METDVLHRTSTGVSYLWIATAVQRILTFSLNVLLLRYVSSEVMGFASSDMELLLSTIMFLSRESCRMVALRSNVHAQADAVATRQQANLAWLPVLPGLAASIGAAAWFFTRTAGSGGHGLQGERAAAVLYCFAAGLELLGEPAFILTQSRLMYSQRAATEIVASVAKCMVTFALAAGAGAGALAFAAGQIAYAAASFAGYWYFARHLGQAQTRIVGSGSKGDRPALMPSILPSKAGSSWEWLSAQVGPSAASLLGGFTSQSLVKHVLTELDRLLLTGLTTREQRGQYAVAANYGSLAARLLFQPLEEAVRGATAKLVRMPVSTVGTIAATVVAEVSPRRQRTKDAGAQVQETAAHDIASTQVAVKLFLTVLRGVLLAGAFIAVFGHYFAGSVVRLALAKWADTQVPAILGAYAVYVLCLGLNGVTEAFAMAAADSGRLSWSNAHLTATSLLCTGAAMWALPLYGSVALVWINCANMLLRTLSSCVYIASLLPRLQGKPEAGASDTSSVSISPASRLHDSLPSSITLVALCWVAGVLHAARAALPAPPQHMDIRQQIPYLATGAACGVVLLVIVWLADGRVVVRELRALRAQASGQAPSTPATIAAETKQAAPTATKGIRSRSESASPTKGGPGSARRRGTGTGAGAGAGAGAQQTARGQ